MKLGRLIKGLTVNDFTGDPDLEISEIAYDSRAVVPGSLFVALRGRSLDGHDFIHAAILKGAAAVVAESADPFKEIDAKAALIMVPDSRDALSRLGMTFFDRPFKDMTLIGITGTNGKTTTSFILESIFLAAGARPGVIGTINYRIPGQVWKAPVTTPESLDLMRILKKMADARVTHAVMEVSSHALDQERTRGCPFAVGVFTNISRDHLDYHGSMESYFQAKSRLFQNLGQGGPEDSARAVINADDPRGKDLVHITRVPVMTYGLGEACDVRADRLHMTRDGLSADLITPFGEVPIRSSLIGDFNMYNILAASAAALCLEVDLNAIASGITRLDGVPGRLELVSDKGAPAVVVDYAHTPDALIKALRSVKPLVKGRLITVFGCGGDRDKGKRREMGQVAGKLSDVVFVTSDNPRTEDPAAIASQIEKGVEESGMVKLASPSADPVAGSGYFLDLDRGNAIRGAIKMAGESDLVLIAGKGHEDYQIIGKERRSFDDRKTAEKVLGTCQNTGTLEAVGKCADARRAKS
ncbi:MAG: UDP-N-acetylmuramoyl-L-alanyl-D-glutamate--2,6-diaminopimelate ligase [Deltaproteobacteria bacterium]|nr:UDP-N-acetylmuramoyl-L-alanyl-D-glutamate--2,6-diaminopimelate ligase [Deltaproteobacteria bacterium]